MEAISKKESVLETFLRVLAAVCVFYLLRLLFLWSVFLGFGGFGAVLFSDQREGRLLYLAGLVFSGAGTGCVIGQLVRRSRKCLDYAATVYFVYFVFSASARPRSVFSLWWVFCAVCSLWVCLFFSRRVSIYFELQPIDFDFESGEKETKTRSWIRGLGRRSSGKKSLLPR
ncbi:MAG: uncharacterized protein A8A55_1668 [Amphiamblys sp. WSBS2006]|nr:MAG: uncharacterized protein A8A55_1668 [Amphiamblys sp. WSBS2006]